MESNWINAFTGGIFGAMLGCVFTCLLVIFIPERHLWSPTEKALYDYQTNHVDRMEQLEKRMDRTEATTQWLERMESLEKDVNLNYKQFEDFIKSTNESLKLNLEETHKYNERVRELQRYDKEINKFLGIEQDRLNEVRKFLKAEMPHFPNPADLPKEKSILNKEPKVSEETKTDTGSKYHRQIFSCRDGQSIWVDVYDVLRAFPTMEAAIDHAVKKLLCAGQRGGKDYLKDLKEAVVSIQRAIQQEEQNPKHRETGHTNIALPLPIIHRDFVFDKMHMEARRVGECPYDTNGDGDCGRPACPWCMRHATRPKKEYPRDIQVLINEWESKQSGQG